MTRIVSLSRSLVNFYLLKAEIDRLLMLSVLFSLLLLGARMFYTHELTFIFLAWNLFLAFVPYFISQWLTNKPTWIVNKWTFVPLFIAWMLFIPNSFYIITDLFHIHYHSGDVPLWFNLLLILSFAWNGLIMGVLSVRQMEKIMQLLWGREHELLFLYPIMWLNALGVFIGRYLRFNSWDIITNPFSLVMNIIDILIHPVVYKNAWGMILCYSVFMTLLYLMIKRASKAIW